MRVGKFQHREVSVAEDAGEYIVEVVSDTTGEYAEAL
jgi:hypothetical protein